MVNPLRSGPARHRPSPTLVIALLALFVALGGAAYAVTKAPKNSVVSKSIKNRAIKGIDIAKGTTIQSATADDIPTAPSATWLLNPIGEVGDSSFIGALAPVTMTAANLTVEMTGVMGVGQARRYELQVSGGASLRCTIGEGQKTCKSNATAVIRTGQIFYIRTENGTGGAASPISMIAYTLKAK